MPTFRLTTPDGKVVRITPPEGATPEEIQSVLDDMIGQMKSVDQPARAEPPASPGYFDLLGEEVSGGLGQMAGPMAPLGVLQIAGAPLTAAGRKAGHLTLDATGSPVAAGIADAAVTGGLGALSGGAGRMAERFTRKAIAPRLPGAATALHEIGEGVVKAKPKSLLPKIASDDLFTALEQANVPGIELPRYNVLAKKLAGTEADLEQFGLALPEVQKVAGKGVKATETIVAGTPSATLVGAGGQPLVTSAGQKALKTVPFETLQSVRKRLGALIRQARGTPVGSEAPELGSLKQAFKAISEDIEKTPASAPGAALLKEANSAARREFFVEEIDHMVAKGFIEAGDSGHPFKSIFKKFQKAELDDELFKGSVTPGEMDELRETFQKLAKLPKKPPGAGAEFGAGAGLRRGGIGAAVGMGIGKLVGADPRMAAEAGFATSVALSAAVSKLLQTQRGRKVLVGFMEHTPRITPQGVSLLTAAARALGQPVSQ